MQSSIQSECWFEEEDSVKRELRHLLLDLFVFVLQVFYFKLRLFCFLYPDVLLLVAVS